MSQFSTTIISGEVTSITIVENGLSKTLDLQHLSPLFFAVPASLMDLGEEVALLWCYVHLLGLAQAREKFAGEGVENIVAAVVIDGIDYVVEVDLLDPMVTKRCDVLYQIVELMHSPEACPDFSIVGEAVNGVWKMR